MAHLDVELINYNGNNNVPLYMFKQGIMTDNNNAKRTAGIKHVKRNTIEFKRKTVKTIRSTTLDFITSLNPFEYADDNKNHL
jgi:hypothetical protein